MFDNANLHEISEIGSLLYTNDLLTHLKCSTFQHEFNSKKNLLSSEINVKEQRR